MKELDRKNFEENVLESEGLVLVDFWSESCEPCKALMPKVEELEKTYSEQVHFMKLDATKARRVAITQKVLGLPTIVLYKDGQKVEEVTKDDATASNIEAMINKHLQEDLVDHQEESPCNSN